jgi:hypothetical protein
MHQKNCHQITLTQKSICIIEKNSATLHELPLVILHNAHSHANQYLQKRNTPDTYSKEKIKYRNGGNYQIQQEKKS